MSEILVVGAGPVGLMLAVELRRHGVACRLIDLRTERSPFAKALGVTPRTLELWQNAGILQEAIDTGCWLSGQSVYVNGHPVKQSDRNLPGSPFGVLSLPQFDTERILADRLAELGGGIERGVELTGFTQDADGVTAQLRHADNQVETWRGRYLVGCDGAHSIVRKTLGLSFEGDRMPVEFLIADVELDWPLEPDRAYLFVRTEGEELRNVLVVIPIYGRGRYRVSTVSSVDFDETAGKEHTVQDKPPPTLAEMQALVSEESPAPVRCSMLRWSGYFRISHRIVDHYRVGRALLAGDAAHIHPPTGGQGMNTGIQDACNLAWKLALTVRGLAAPDLLDSYEAERLAIGQDTVRRTTERTMSLARSDDDELAILRADSQLDVNYRFSRWVSEEVGTGMQGPRAGDRAPDAAGLVRRGVANPFRLHDLLRTPRHILLLAADSGADWPPLLAVAERFAALVRTYVVADPGLPEARVGLPWLVDAAGTFRKEYDARGGSAYLIRPDGYLGYRTDAVTADRLVAALERTIRLPQ